MKKKTILGIIVAAGLMMAAVSFNSCTKQEDAAQVLQDKYQKMTPGDLLFYNSIVNFKQKIKYIKENPQYKSGETISVDSAIWLLESTFNYEYSSTSENYTAVQTDSALIEIEVGNDGKISLDDVSIAYYEMFYAVQAIYGNINYDNKGLVMVNLQSVSSKSNSTTIKVGTVTGSKGIDPNPGPFGEEDYWRYGNEEGTCDFEQDTTDAARKIWFKTNASIPGLLPPAGYCFSYSDPVTWTVAGGQDKWRRPNDPLDNYLDYYLYYADPANGTITNAVLCLEPNEMNNYYNWLQNIIYNWLPQEPGMENHVFLVVSKFKGEPLGSPVKYYHWGTLEYAIRHLVLCPDPPDPGLGD